MSAARRVDMDAVARAVAATPPLTSEQVTRIESLLRPYASGGDAA